MIKIYVNNHFDGTYTVMVVDADMPLHAIKVMEDDLWNTVGQLKVDFSDTGREVRVFEN